MSYQLFIRETFGRLQFSGKQDLRTLYLDVQGSPIAGVKKVGPGPSLEKWNNQKVIRLRRNHRIIYGDRTD
jgi:hypothetical protein